MKILITGGLGGLGRHVSERLLEKGHDLTVFDIKTAKNERLAKNYFIDHIEWGNILDEDSYRHLLKDQDVIIHLAYILPPWSESNPRAYDINVLGTRRLIELTEQRNPNCRFIFSSSVTVFGYTHDQEPPITVNHPMSATDNYSSHKIQSEKDVRNSNLEWIILRFAEAPYLNVDLKPKNLKRMYSIPWNQRVEFVHPLDVATAVTNAVSIPSENTRNVYIIGGGSNCQHIYYEQMKELLGIFKLSPPDKDKFHDGHYYLDWYDTKRSQEVLNFQERTLNDYISDLENELGWKVGFIKFFAPIVDLFI
ncbi:MAG: NAD-dependent epimerase/dehydratase family protein [Candidatus Lokiarchaeota archaeon]|nr:NAD-dependent epimerase/dehydratase family protein [Candidatus Lokiarchaeota archaeon]